MAGFEDFKNGIFPGLLTGLSNLWNKLTGSALTSAENQANVFNASEAEKNRMFQQQMSDTQYQRGVVDMKSAGLNPALMMSGASGASTPSGASASSVAPGSSDPVGLIGQLANLALLRSQKQNIDADTEKKRSETDLTKQNIVNAAATLGEIRSRIKGLDLSNEAQSIINSYLERKEKVALENMTLEGNKLAAEWTEIQQRIANLSAEEKKILQDIVESKERVRYLLSQEALSVAQKDEVISTISKINVETSNLVKGGKILDKDIDFYEWNHGEAFSIAGSKPGFRMRAKSSVKSSAKSNISSGGR